MSKFFQNEVFERRFDNDSGAVFENLEFHRCRFDGCVLSNTKDPKMRSIVRRVSLIDCHCSGFNSVGCAVIDDVLIDGLKTDDLLQSWSIALRHVTIRGKIGRIMLSDLATTSMFSPPWVNESFKEANAAFYAKVDWALDISQAEFKECDIRGIPARLIRRDAETQVVVTREKALEGRWKDIDLSDTYWHTAISFLLDRTDPDTVLVAPKRSKAFPQLLDGLKRLRDAGIAEPG